MKNIFKKGFWTSLVAVVLVLMTCISAFALSFDYDGTGSSGSGSGSTLKNTSFSLKQTTGTEKFVIGYRFSVADSTGKVVGKRVDVYNSSWFLYSDVTKYTQYHAAKYQYSKRNWINGTASEFDNDYKISSLNGFNYASSSSIDSTMPQDPSKIGTWLSKNDYKNSYTLFVECDTIPQNGYRLIVEPIIQCKIDGDVNALTPTELAVCGGRIYGYNTSPAPAYNEFRTLNNYVLRYFPNLLRTPNKQSNLWGAASYLSDNATYKTVINSGYGVGIVNATDVQKEYTVTFVPNGGTYTYNSKIYTAKQSFTVAEGTKIIMPTCARDYWAFTGWTIIKAPSSGL